MFRVSFAFVAFAAGSLVLGVGMGIYMGVQRDFALAPVHAHLNLLGWVSLAIFGLVYRAFPELAFPRAATLHLALSGAGAVLFPVGLYLEIFQERGELIAVAALLWLAGAIIFFALVVRLLATSTPASPTPARS